MKILAVLLLSVAAIAQEPKLSVSQSVALGSLSDRAQKNQEEAKAIGQVFKALADEFAKANPGYHLDIHTWQPTRDEDKAETLDKKGAKQ